MTIHELANFTGCSIRALHYYDKIGLLKPYSIETNGYRKYNEDSLIRLQQILFYKELNLPLKTIKEIMNQPDFDRKEAIKEQKELLIAKRTRLTRLIDQMEQILEGDDNLDFSVFEHNELEEVYRYRIMHLDEEFQQALIREYGGGSIDECIHSMMKNESRIKESAIKHYGSVRKYIDELKQLPFPKAGMGKLQAKLDATVKQIAAYKEQKDVSLPEIQTLVVEWKATFEAIGKLNDMEDITETFRNIYHGYIENPELIKIIDKTYGDGAAIFIGKAMEYYDIKQNI